MMGEMLDAKAVPEELRGLAALMLLVGEGSIEDLRSLGFEVQPSAPERLFELFPELQGGAGEGCFATSQLPPGELDAALTAALLAPGREGERTGLSDHERCFERLSALAAYLLEKGDPERSLSLLRLTSQLLSARAEAPGSQAAPQPAASGQGRAAMQSQTAPAGADAPGPDACTEAPPVPTAATASPEAQPNHSQSVPLMRVRLFGDLEIEVGGKPLPRSTVHRGLCRTLFCLLVLNQGKGLSRETVIEWLWPSRDPLRTRSSFYNLWHRLCEAFRLEDGTSPYFMNGEALLRVDPRFVSSDVAEFERLSRVVFFEQDDLEQCFAAIDRLEQLYTNDVLAGSASHPRIKAAQERYRNMLLDVLLAASELHLNSGNHTMALWYARRAFETDPKREDVYRVLMATQEASGHRTGAMNTYQDCRRYLDEELGVLPSSKTTAIYQDLIMDGQ